LLDLAGAPDRRLRVVLVAGTKGKGSTCAMLASVLGAAGVRCGLYTKPHLQDYRERIRVDGRAVSPEAFGAATRRLKRLAGELPSEAGEPTTFEVTTALALEVFAREDCEIAAVEVGLGGRLDATNATDPEVSVITSISYDHTAILGRTLGAIAAEKAGILRTGRPALLAQQRPAAMRALRAACQAVGADCRVVPPRERVLPLAGVHQWQNAALAAEAARTLLGDIGPAIVDHGLERVRWPGRFELIGDRLVLDGAHNGASAAALAVTLADFAHGRPVVLVIGINRDKDARAVLRPLLPLARCVWATQTEANPRALPAAQLAHLCRRLGVQAHQEPDLRTALNAALQAAPDTIVCLTGSLMLVGQARGVLGLPTPETLW
jgi:dihydrofolate synthase/folylpolyglutamate synthase